MTRNHVYKRAERYFRTLLAAVPTNTDAGLMVVLTLWAQGRVGEAGEQLRKMALPSVNDSFSYQAVAGRCDGLDRGRIIWFKRTDR